MVFGIDIAFATFAVVALIQCFDGDDCVYDT